jgi:hypothetical protein
LEFSGRFQDGFVEITQPFYKSAAEVSLPNGIVEYRLGSRTGWMVEPPLRWLLGLTFIFNVPCPITTSSHPGLSDAVAAV